MHPAALPFTPARFTAPLLRLCATLALAACAAPALAVVAIDARGDYVGGYAGSTLGDLDVNSNRAVTAVPGPARAALLGAGVGALALLRCRRPR